MTIGHPDYQATVAAGVPRLIKNVVTAATGSWGPVTVPVPAGGSYLLAVRAAVPANVLMTDITVQHLDVAGNEVYRDSYGAVMAGTGASAVLSLPGPTICRGNIYGSTLKVSGMVAASAFINTVLATAGLTASAATIDCYALPVTVADIEPKLCNGSGDLGAFTGLVPGGMLSVWDAVAIAPGGLTQAQPLIPYSGPVIVDFEQTGVTTNANVDLRLLSYTVANGATHIQEKVFGSVNGRIGTSWVSALPACLCVGIADNIDGALTATLHVSVTAQRSA